MENIKFSVDKVKRGVCEAYGSVGEECPEALIDSLSKNLYIYENIQTSEIRRQVEECLMSINKKVAKAYIAKNEERDANGKILKNKNDFITNYINASNASTGSKFDPNANVTNKNISLSGKGTVTIKVYIDGSLKKTVEMNLNNATTLVIE